MRRNELETVSVWQETTPAPPADQKAREQCDVCIIGAGIAGLTAAYLLRRAGRDVQLIDAHDIGAGETGRTTAHLASVLDDRFLELRRLHGADGARLAAQSHAAAIDLIERIVRESEIDCDFERVDGILFCARPEQVDLLQQEAEAALDAGFHDLAPVEQFGLPALRFPRQAMFHVGRYLRGLAQDFQARGGHIVTGTPAIAVEDGEVALVRLQGGHEIRARHVIVATNTPFNDRLKMHTKQAAYRTYVVGFAVPAGSFPAQLLWDLDDPYHYVRLVRGVGGGELLLVGGEDHKTGQAEDPARRFTALTAWARERFAGLGDATYRWSGQVMEPIDGLAFIGRNPGEKNVYLVTGDSGNGMTHGTLGAMIIGDLIDGRENPWAALYDPARKSLQAAGTFVDENANVLGHLVKDWIGRSDIRERRDIPPGGGAIVRDGLSLVAVHRDASGQFHELSAACTHLGCVVQWNGVEKSWDCPCHGSRFAPDGTVLNGPAAKALEPHDSGKSTAIPARASTLLQGAAPLATK